MKKILILTTIIFIGFTSCKKQLDIDPRQSIDFNSALSSVDAINAAVNSVYGGLKSTALYGRDLLAVSDAMADVGFANNKSGRLVGENRNNLGAHLVLWGTAYSLINECNLILAAIPTSPGTPAQKSSWEGQMRFLRALLYFELVKTYAYIPTADIPAQNRGGVVIKTDPTNSATNAANYFPKRATVAECYNFLKTELNAAIPLLPASGSVALATQTAGRALLSRVALYNGDWSIAVTESTAALATSVGALTTATTYVSGWRQSIHPESIFEIRYATVAENVGVNTSLQTTYTGLAAIGSPTTTGGGFGDFVPTNTLLTEYQVSYPNLATFPAPAASFPSITYGADVRGQLFEWGTNFRGTRFVECTKFFGKNGQINLDNVPVFRKSELLLNRAEANYRLSLSTGGATAETAALADVNTLRSNRGLPAVTLTGTALFDEIIQQRRLEFAFEGHRFFDLKRLGRDIIKTPLNSNLLATDIRMLPAIPQGDIDGNPNMLQNQGY